MVVGARVELAADIAVAKAGDRELASADSLEQREVVRIGQTESTNLATAVGYRSGDGVKEPGAGSGVAHSCKRVQVGVIGSFGDLGAPMQIGHAFAQREPLEFAVRIVLAVSKDLEVGGVSNGRFDPKDTASFVVHLDRVASEPVFDAHTLSAIFEAADDL